MAEITSVSHYDDDESTNVRGTYNPQTGETHLFREIPINTDEYLHSMGITQEQIDERRRQTEQHMSYRLLNELAELRTTLQAEREANRKLLKAQNRQIQQLTTMVEELRDRPAAPAPAPEPEPTPETAPEPAPAPEPTPAPAPAPETGHRRTVRETVWYRRPRNWLGGLALAAVLGQVGYNTWHGIESEESEAAIHRIEAKLASQTVTKPDGTSSYFENSHAGGHGLQLDYPRGTKITKNLDGTYTFKLASGKTMKLVWNRQGKLTSDTIRALKKEKLDVGWANTKFTNRAGSTYTHEYSIIRG